MWRDPMFWYAVAFGIFCVLAFVYGRKPMGAWLDAKIGAIRDELDRARALRTEAEALLADYRKKHAVAMKEAEQIVRFAKEEAVRLKAQAEADLKTALVRHEQQAEGRLRMAETEALAAVRAAAVDQAITMARKALAVQDDARLTDQAIAELPQLAASSRAKAA